MRTLFLPQGPGKSVEQFTKSALESPLSGWQTFGFGVRNAAEQSLLGVAAREAEAPDLAKVPVSGGRGGVNWRFETPADVEARGDKLYDSEDAFKASPFYRENVPFEPGMTESRARALAEQTDLRAIRDYYSRKRPLTAMTGQFVGAALAPENYIPVLGEFAAAATTARLGKIAGRALTTGADAALNTGAFQLLTREERRQLGDDTSWQAVFENMAFAAAAGGVLGGLRGGIEAVRGRYSAPVFEPAPAPRAEPPGVVARPVDVSPGALLPEMNYRLDLGESGGARFAPEWRVAADVLDQVETPAMRAKSAAVMNDAVSGMVLEGQIRLGEQSRVNLDELAVAVRRTGITPDIATRQWASESKIVDDTGAPRLVYHGTNADFAQHDLGKGNAENLDNFGFFFTDSADTAAAYAIGEGGNVRPVYLNIRNPLVEKGVPGTNPVVTWEQGKASRIAQARKNGNDGIIIDNGASKMFVAFKPDQIRSAFDARPANTATNFSVPPPEPAPSQLAASYKLVDSLPKAATPETTRLIESAKAEGLDPETGGHDLEPDIDILRERGALSAEDEAALAAADETFIAAKAWGEVAEQLITCKASGI